MNKLIDLKISIILKSLPGNQIRDCEAKQFPTSLMAFYTLISIEIVLKKDSHNGIVK